MPPIASYKFKCIAGDVLDGWTRYRVKQIKSSWGPMVHTDLLFKEFPVMMPIKHAVVCTGPLQRWLGHSKHHALNRYMSHCFVLKMYLGEHLLTRTCAQKNIHVCKHNCVSLQYIFRIMICN